MHNLNTHIKNNPRDVHNQRSMKLLEEKIRRLVRYYKNKELLPDDWKYDITTVKLLVD